MHWWEKRRCGRKAEWYPDQEQRRPDASWMGHARRVMRREVSVVRVSGEVVVVDGV